jgi:hypothetical protein
VVDVRSSVAATNIDKELFDTVPSGNNPFTMAAFVPGMVTDRIDVGGNEGAQQYGLQIFGSDPNQKTFSIDGLKVNWPGGEGGATMQYYDFAMFEEYNFQTSQQSAEVDVPGVYMNMVTKSGGNEFASDNVFYFQNDALQGNNIDEELEAQGITQGNPIDIAYDWNSTVGGPIVQDKAWFFGSVRWWVLDQFQTGARSSWHRGTTSRDSIAAILRTSSSRTRLPGSRTNGPTTPWDSTAGSSVRPGSSTSASEECGARRHTGIRMASAPTISASPTPCGSPS